MIKSELLDVIRNYVDKTTVKSKFKPGVDFVPVSGAVISTDDLVSVCDTVLDGWFTEGKKAKKFSELMCDYIGIRFSILCNSGSSANLLAMMACKDHYPPAKAKKVITCATGFPTTIAPIIQAGYVPLFVDIDPEIMNPNAEDIAYLLEREDVAGVIQAHTMGFPFNVFPICASAAKNGKFFVEDCADSLGSEIDGEVVGRFGDMSTFSFFPAHTLTMGEGGMVLTSSAKLNKSLRNYRDWGRDCVCLPGQNDVCGKRFTHTEFGKELEGYDHKYIFTKLGYNLKITEMQAALGVSQFGSLQEFISARKDNYEYIYDGLSDLSDYIQFVRPIVGADPVPFGFPITVLHETSNGLVQFLFQNKIHTRPVFAGNITYHPMMNGVAYYVDERGSLQGSDYVMRHTFWIGCHPELNNQHLDYMIDKIHEYFKKEI